jgi:hypothetical protein
MPADPAQVALERVLAAVGQCLERQSAESLLRLRADTEMQGRIEELAVVKTKLCRLVLLRIFLVNGKLHDHKAAG